MAGQASAAGYFAPALGIACCLAEFIEAEVLGSGEKALEVLVIFKGRRLIRIGDSFASACVLRFLFGVGVCRWQVCHC